MTELEMTQRAKMYMDKLAQGIDPISGTEVPEDSTLNNVRLARCFFYVSGILDQVIANGGHVGQKPKKADFFIAPEVLAGISPTPYPIRITEFVEMVHQAAGNSEMRKPSTTVITNWLLDKGFLKKDEGLDGKIRRLPTAAGIHLGLSAETRQGQYGEYLAVYYNTAAQRFLLDNLESILTEKPSET